MMLEGHRPECRAAIYHSTRFEKDWPIDPERCDLCARRARLSTVELDTVNTHNDV